MSVPISLHPGHRDGEGARVKARGWGSLEKGEKGGRRGRRINRKKTNVNGCVFISLGGRKKKGVTVDLGLSIPNCLGHNSECLDMCGCLCVNSNSRAPLHEDLLQRSKPRALDISHLVFRHGQEWTLQSCCRCCCCYKHATVFAIHSLYLLMSVAPKTLRNCTMNCMCGFVDILVAAGIGVVHIYMYIYMHTHIKARRPKAEMHGKTQVLALCLQSSTHKSQIMK